jgi:hypothetical protein
MRGIKPSVTLAVVGVVGLALGARAYVDQTGRGMASVASRFVANSPKPPTDAARGIAAADLNESRKEMPRVPIESYTAEMPPDVARTWVDEFKEAGPDPIRFAWSVPADRNQPHAYRVRGPTFLIAFNNTQNNAKHIHSVWRNVLSDIGVPLASR